MCVIKFNLISQRCVAKWSHLHTTCTVHHTMSVDCGFCVYNSLSEKANARVRRRSITEHTTLFIHMDIMFERLQRRNEMRSSWHKQTRTVPACSHVHCTCSHWAHYKQHRYYSLKVQLRGDASRISLLSEATRMHTSRHMHNCAIDHGCEFRQISYRTLALCAPNLYVMSPARSRLHSTIPCAVRHACGSRAQESERQTNRWETTQTESERGNDKIRLKCLQASILHGTKDFSKPTGTYFP